ncbi:MAG: glycosyltransferase, partial [Bacteroidetes bacterium]|nr:glycosyltransferase [Bacteroidota bacterium]
SRLALFSSKKNTSDELPPTSIVICARNEEANLRKNLPAILQQHYPFFEVIIVDDASSDGTLQYLMSLEDAHLKVISIGEEEKNTVGKKAALSKGIQEARYEYILLTDADCKPASDSWIRDMTLNLSGEKDILLAYSPMYRQKSVFNKWVRFEVFYTALQYFSFALCGLPYMGVGRNLAYRKKLFNKDLLLKHIDVPSGDDDLFINEVANARNTSITTSENAFTFSQAKSSWKSWFEQKVRHLQAGVRYKPIHQFLLGALFSSHLIFYVGMILLLVVGYQNNVVLMVFLLRLLVQSAVLLPSMIKLGEADLWIWFPLLDFTYVIIYSILAPSLLWTKEIKWK